jgi:hypothetical protein
MKRFKSIVAAGFAVLIAAAYVMPAVTASAVSSAALSIVPKKNYVIEPGKSVKDTLLIRNLDSTVPLQLTLRVVDFTFTDDGGTPKLMLDPNAPQTTWSLKPFMTVPKNVTVAPGSSETVNMNVAIPAGHGAGSYYSAIVYSSGSGEGGNVGLSASGVTLAFVTVPGKVHEDLQLQKFGAYKPPMQAGKQGAFMFITTEMPQMLAYNLKNNGNVTEAPVGNITLRSMFGQEQTIENINPNKSLALIGQSRTFTSCIKLKTQDVNFNDRTTKTTECESPGLWPGMYTATLDAFYGQNGNNTKEIIRTATFWYLPWWFILLVTVVLVIIAFYVWRIVRRIKYGRPGPRTKAPRRK